MASGTQETPLRLIEDERWELVQRIAASEPFQKSARLRCFLLYVCERALANHLEDIHEQQIGCQVYGKRPDYNASEDNIVRVDARRLRKALEEYFSTDGRRERVILHIPKGSYVPVFQAREEAPRGGASSAGAIPASGRVRVTRLLAGIKRPVLPPLAPVAVAGTIVFGALALWQWTEARQLRGELAENPRPPLSASGIWSYVFDSQHRTTIVLADVGYSILQGQTGKRLSLADYLDRRYIDELATGELASFGRFKMSVSVDVDILADILRTNPRFAGNTLVKHARDVSLQDFKEGHHILVGSRAANPWCEMFAGGRNFLYDYDTHRRRSYFRNREPLAGEQHVYYNRGEDGSTAEQYGVVALLPNLSHTGRVLIIEGTNISGTQTAWEFVRDPKFFAEFEAGLKQKDDKLGPYFEVLVRTYALAMNATESSYVAHRILKVEREIPVHP